MPTLALGEEEEDTVGHQGATEEVMAGATPAEVALVVVSSAAEAFEGDMQAVEAGTREHMGPLLLRPSIYHLLSPVSKFLSRICPGPLPTRIWSSCSRRLARWMKQRFSLSMVEARVSA